MIDSDDVVKRVEKSSEEFAASLAALIEEYNNCVKMSLKMERVIHNLVKDLEKNKCSCNRS